MTGAGSTTIDRTDWTTTAEMSSIAARVMSTAWGPSPGDMRFTDAAGRKVLKRDATPPELAELLGEGMQFE